MHTHRQIAMAQRVPERHTSPPDHRSTFVEADRTCRIVGRSCTSPGLAGNEVAEGDGTSGLVEDSIPVVADEAGVHSARWPERAT